MAAGPSADGVLLLDKPAGITSTRALATARRALGGAKGGHTGTLDPFATGLLPLVFGEATKFSRFLIDSTKAYRATLRLGQETETGDPESPVAEVSSNIPSSEQIADVLRTFTGDIDQVPPMHSALHVNGKRLYEYARAGLTVARAARQVHVFSIEVKSIEGPSVVLDVACSKGTYIRVLAADIGRALGCGAYLTDLRRTAVGDFRIEAATPLEALIAMGADAARTRLLPVDSMIAGLPRIEVDGETAQRFRHGQPISAASPVGPCAVFGEGLGFLGAGEGQGDLVVPLRLLAEPPKSPDFA